MNIELFNKMSEIVEKNVKGYKDDFYKSDVNLINKYDLDNFLWIVRDSGTKFININHLRYKETFDYNAFEYYKDFKNVKLYLVNTSTFEIKRLDYSKTFEKVRKELQTPKSVELYIGNKTYNINIKEYCKRGFILEFYDKNKIDYNLGVDKRTYKFS